MDRVDLLRRTYDTNKGGADDLADRGPEIVNPELWKVVDPAFELHERSDLPDAKVYRGREAAAEFFRKTAELFSEVRWEPREFIELGDAVVVETKLVGVGKGSEVPIEGDEFHVWQFRDDKVISLRGFPTREEALAAAAR